MVSECPRISSLVSFHSGLSQVRSSIGLIASKVSEDLLQGAHNDAGGKSVIRISPRHEVKSF